MRDQYAHVVAGAPLPLGRDWSDPGAAGAAGAWTARGGHLTLVADPPRRGRASPALSGDWRRDRIVLDLRYAPWYTAGRKRQYVVQYVVRMRRALDTF